MILISLMKNLDLQLMPTVTAATVFLLIVGAAWVAEGQIVIAHRGASGYLPEHTLASKALAYGMGADYIEQDVVLTSDDHAVVLHDIHLDTVTNVAEVFPDRARENGRHFAIDFTLDEIRQLSVYERFSRETGAAVYTRRFPLHQARFSVPTLAEEIELVQGLNQSTGRDVGIYPEIKSPAWHRAQGKDISRIVLDLLNHYGYRGKDDKIFVQCFDAGETRRLRNELETRVRLVQLIGDNDWDEAPTDFDRLRTAEGIAEIAQHADGIGPWLPHVVELDADGQPRVTSLVAMAHSHGLVVHPFTFRADSLPAYADSFEATLDIFFGQAGVDGVFTDFPDRAVKFLESRPN